MKKKGGREKNESDDRDDDDEFALLRRQPATPYGHDQGEFRFVAYSSDIVSVIDTAGIVSVSGENRKWTRQLVVAPACRETSRDLARRVQFCCLAAILFFLS